MPLLQRHHPERNAILTLLVHPWGAVSWLSEAKFPNPNDGEIKGMSHATQTRRIAVQRTQWQFFVKCVHQNAFFSINNGAVTSTALYAILPSILSMPVCHHSLRIPWHRWINPVKNRVSSLLSLASRFHLSPFILRPFHFDLSTLAFVLKSSYTPRPPLNRGDEECGYRGNSWIAPTNLYFLISIL